MGTADSREPLLVIWRFNIEAQDGCSAQIRRLLKDFESPVLQLTTTNLPSNHQAHFELRRLNIHATPPIGLPVGGSVLRKFWGKTVRELALRMARARYSPKPTKAYVVVADESQAIFARAALQAFGIEKYLLHIMDYFDPVSQPLKIGSSFYRLCVGSDIILGTTSFIARSLFPFKVRQFPLSAGFRSGDQSIEERRDTMIMGGAIYEKEKASVKFLTQTILPAWRHLKRFQDLEWLYYGNDFDKLPRELAPFVRNLGTPSDEELEAHFKSAKIGLIPIRHEEKSTFMNSFPSRLCDYLSAGLPTLTPEGNKTAFGEYISDNANQAVIPVGNVKEATKALESLLCDKEKYRFHYLEALSSAEKFSPEPVRVEFQSILRSL